MSAEEATNPVAEEELVSTTAEGVADEATAQGDDQTDESEETDEVQPEDETEEIDYDGQKHRIPKALKEAFLRQSDYTRKTQEVAEERRALAARNTEIAQQAEAQAQTLEQRVQLATVNQALAQYAELDWSQYAEQYGTNAAIAAQAQWRQLESAQGQLRQDIASKEQEHRLSGERAVATAIQEAEQILSRDLPGYSRELVSNVAKVAQSIGFTPDELRESFVGADGKADTRSFTVLARLHAAESELAALKAKTTTAKQVEKQTSIQPARTVGQKAGQYKAGLNDELPIDEWNRRRNAQLAKAR